MFTLGIEQSAQIYHTFTIEQQCVNSRPSGWRRPEDQRKIVTPHEMFVPTVTSRMVERHAFATDWIRRIDLIVLVIVAALAGKGQVL